MSRNQNSRFALNPTNIDIPRSTFNRNSSVKLSMNTSDLVPFYLDEVLPGDTHQIKTSKVVRLQTLLTPMMDNLYLDTYYFFVPMRLVWEHWKEFQGENTDSAWIPQTVYTIPQITSPSGGWSVGSIADYLGVPTYVDDLSISSLPFRAYALICDQWFRDENLSDPLNIPVTDATVVGSNGTNYITDVAKGGMPFKVSKYHDYFTSALPAPQKGPDVTIGLSDFAPVVGNGHGLFISNGSYGGYMNGDEAAAGARFYTSSTVKNLGATDLNLNNAVGGNKVIGVPSSFSTGLDSGLVADLSSATAVSINELRMAFQVQKMLEKDARGGTRYVEILKSHFGVTSPDARLQRVEYLGGNRIPININQVVQNSSTDATSPQGNVAGYSVTGDSHGDFIKSFTEHGYIIGVCCVRYDHTYQQGLDRLWSRKVRTDFYMPVFANIGEQAILNKEIFAQGSSVVDSDGNVVDDQVFGYNEAWADYRFKNSRTCGEMRSNAPLSLDVWHLGDDYSSLPYLSDSWIREDKTNVDRVLAVTSQVSNQIFGDFYIQNKTTRPMPLYSIPGLVDHH